MALAEIYEPEVSVDLAKNHGLTAEEYGRILEILGRSPTYTELGVFSVMWSEHCSYKNSISVLKTIPREGGRLLVGAGEENAGLVDIGNGFAVAFKIESHNHPSAIEPYQGAATGVGGIMRDIFTMGARPIANLNSLRFGTLDSDRTRYLFAAVVRGIGDYGNCVGVPTVGGEVYFEKSYAENPLVNAMTVGLVEHSQTASAIAEGAGNPVLIVGSTTGRDGIHGATFASEEISEASESKRPNVQVGDPFTEKLLLEASLEAIQSGALVGIQDMGAAGITCSTSEMSAKGKSGMEIELSRVPVRENGMTPYEIMLSESQERMLLVAKLGAEEKVREIFRKWDLNAVIIGKVTDDGLLRIKYHGEVFAEIPADVLVLGGGAPVYEREARRPDYLDKTSAFDPATLREPADYNAVLLQLLASPSIASKAWVYEQYDSMVGTNTVVAPGSDAAVVRIKNTNRAIAMKTDCNGRYVYLNPRRGGQIAVAECARNLVCSGAEPLAITNCLNFGNPYKPEAFWQFREAVAGMGEGCRALNTPVTGGNVSFYNENPDGPIFPTPTIGMIGLVEDLAHVTTSFFKNTGDVIVLLGENRAELGGSEYLKIIHGRIAGEIPTLDLDREKQLQDLLLEAIRAGLIRSAHDLSDGGLAVAAAECCIQGRNHMIGAEIELEDSLRGDFLLYGESQSRILVSLRPGDLTKFQNIAARYQIEVAQIGRTGGDRLRIGQRIDVALSDLSTAYFDSIAKIMDGSPPEQN